MFTFTCPVCGENLTENGGSLVCGKGHCYDKAKQGYVNLLLSQKASGKRHGDDKLMVAARSGFLSLGCYNPLMKAIAEEAEKYAFRGCRLLDIGCGEGMYTEFVRARLAEKGAEPIVGGIDISKDALIAAGKRNKAFSLAVAGVSKLPVADNSCDILLNIFAPHAADEFSRVMKKSCVLIRVIPLENHLMALKKAIYENAYPNVVDNVELKGLKIVNERRLKYSFTLSGTEDIKNLFLMTPYYYKTSESDQKKLDALNTLTAEAEFLVLSYFRD